MPDCPNGSRVKPEQTEHWIWATAETLASFAPWFELKALSIVPNIVPVLVGLEEMCSKPPPPLPELDWFELWKSPNLFGIPTPLAEWLLIYFMNAYWEQYCECNPVSGSVPCEPFGPIGGTYTGQVNGFNPYKIAGPWDHPYGFASGLWHVHNYGGTNNKWGIEWRFYDAAHTHIATAASPGDPNTTWDGDFIGSPWTQAMRDAIRTVELWGFAYGPDQTAQLTYTADNFAGCTGEVIPPGPEPAPPPEDPGVPPLPPLPAGCTLDQVCQQLRALTGMVGSVGQRIDVLQRFGLPFAYIPGSPRAGLSGGGSFAISRLVGVKLDITSPLPPRQLEGVPPYIWDLGWMSISTADGMIVEKRITRDTEVWQPDRMQEATLFGYYFKPGVVATVTELRPEPW